MEICDTRGIAESVQLNPDKSAEDDLIEQVNKFSPDVAILVLGCTHRDDVNKDVQFLRKLSLSYQEKNGVRLPIVVVINKCDEAFPPKEVLSSFDAFSKPEIKLFLEQPVYDARGHCRKRSEEIYEKVTKGSGIEQITNLLLTFYQVRCNLFHGQKILRCERDIALVENSSVLLQGYLDAVLNSNKKTRFYL